MPAFEPDTIPDAQLTSWWPSSRNPSAGGGGGGGRNQTPLPPPPDGVTRYTGPLGSMFRTTDGMVAISPPWGEIVAYDLNEGTIKWRAPVGTVPALAAKGIRNTGNAQRLHRNGPAVTAGGLIFIGNRRRPHVPRLRQGQRQDPLGDAPSKPIPRAWSRFTK